MSSWIIQYNPTANLGFDMSFDSSMLHILKFDFNDKLVGGTIRHIQQVDAHTVVIKILGRTGTQFLLLSAHPMNARVHFINQPSKGQKQSHFANFLINHLVRGEITQIEQIGWDRILKITIDPFVEILKSAPKSLIVELMGKHSNIVLVEEDSQQILESIKHIDDTMSRFRVVLPGEVYELPPQQEKLDPIQVSQREFVAAFQDQPDISWRTIMNVIDGINPTLAKEIVYRTGEGRTLEQLWDVFQGIRVYFDPDRAVPQVTINPQDPHDILGVSILPLTQIENSEIKDFDTLSQALDFFHDMVATKEMIQSQRYTLNQVLTKRHDAVERKLVSLRRDLANADQAEQYRVKGELLMANLHQVEPGQKRIMAQNYYDSDLKTISIDLDPQVSPSQNAQRYFRKYNKAKRGKSVINQLIADNEAEIEVLGHYCFGLESSQTLDDFLSLRSEFEKKGWVSDKSKRKNDNQTVGTFRKYISPDGFQIYVGRNSVENDLLLRRVAKSQDMWLHARQIHGSHVIIRNPEKKPGIPMPTLLQAAQLAAVFSKAKHSNHVPVDYTWAKHVVKRRGIGFVHYTHQKTLNVEPKIQQTEAKLVDMYDVESH